MATIYFVSDGENIKIGRTNNQVDVRKDQLQVGNANTLIVKYSIENMEDTFESYIHGICNKYHIRGEWFKSSVLSFLLKHPWYNERMKIEGEQCHPLNV